MGRMLKRKRSRTTPIARVKKEKNRTGSDEDLGGHPSLTEQNFYCKIVVLLAHFKPQKDGPEPRPRKLGMVRAAPASGW